MSRLPTVQIFCLQATANQNKSGFKGTKTSSFQTDDEVRGFSSDYDK